LKGCDALTPTPSSKRLDFGGDLEHDADPGIYKRNFYHFWIGAIV